ncbi:hypothetical protein B9G99_12150 [Kushneria konosiri]|uniref:Uncharacterized protein n=1 Tax=Kushneria konosiri TaxID=698828 RepID=A0A2Z2H851_9GAMM|nr:hypothetical protein B9G99_12150 [Kushneria konosiri]
MILILHTLDSIFYFWMTGCSQGHFAKETIQFIIYFSQNWYLFFMLTKSYYCIIKLWGIKIIIQSDHISLELTVFLKTKEKFYSKPFNLKTKSSILECL